MRKSKNDLKPEYKKETSIEVFPFMPILFWKRCSECKDLIKREIMFKIIVKFYKYRFDEFGPHISKEKDKLYFCDRCCNSVEHLKIIFNNKYAKLYKY